ncbi:MAG TPA: NAD-dependent deacetylase [Alphaproteobacteria bacterium]|nr:NAD-dependent deacetylase [Alphaproteobacteria bacterium]
MSDRLKDLITQARRAVVFTGAGISTESGIPDFRSPGGIWSKQRVIYFDEFCRSREARIEAWTRLFNGREMLLGAEPNAGHRAVAKLVEQGKVSHVITQNVDGLHQRSGIADGQVIELHGNSTYAKCLNCGARYSLEAMEEFFVQTGEPPTCEVCGGLVKSATISFGQSMPELEMERAHAATQGCDLMLAIGSSLVVYPAAGFPVLAKRQGARLAILNREPTELDDMADLVVNEEIGPTLARVMGIN